MVSRNLHWTLRKLQTSVRDIPHPLLPLVSLHLITFYNEVEYFPRLRLILSFGFTEVSPEKNYGRVHNWYSLVPVVLGEICVSINWTSPLQWDSLRLRTNERMTRGGTQGCKNDRIEEGTESPTPKEEELRRERDTTHTLSFLTVSRCTHQRINWWNFSRDFLV